MEKKIDTIFLAKANIGKNPIRSLSLITIIAVFVIFLFCGSMFSVSLSNGINSLSNRLGADILIVPEGYQTNFESVLLKGEPSEFYLPQDIIEKLNDIDGVRMFTSQLYVATLQASCCSYPVQIIGIDYDSDFVIKPWLEKNRIQFLNDDEVIIGSKVIGEKNSNIKFFEQNLVVTGKLTQTGMGFDSSVFVNMKTAKKIAAASEIIKKNKAAEGEKISVLLLKLKPEYDSLKVANSIIRRYPNGGIYALFAKKFVGQISSQLKVLSGYMYISIIAIWIMSLVLLSVIFSTIINERKKELGILRILGASKKQVLSLIVIESLIIGIIGSIIGTFAGILFVLSVIPFIQQTLNLPFLMPTFFNFILMLICSVGIGIILGSISSFFCGNKIIKKDAYVLIKENE